MLTSQPGQQSTKQNQRQRKKEYNPEVTNLVSVLKQMIDIAGYEMVGRIVLRDKDTGKEYR